MKKVIFILCLLLTGCYKESVEIKKHQPGLQPEFKHQVDVPESQVGKMRGG